MTENLETNVREVSIIKKTTTMTSEEYFSIHLKAPDETVESLLQKAIVAALNSTSREKQPAMTPY